mmetsp:Transcript_47594/g.125620  ORF Transcript_47594/g.125620 Transcript_47594/m.125620 type:complete len:280 (+) Transcript_47594:1164-2003(+)
MCLKPLWMLKIWPPAPSPLTGRAPGPAPGAVPLTQRPAKAAAFLISARLFCTQFMRFCVEMYEWSCLNLLSSSSDSMVTTECMASMTACVCHGLTFMAPVSTLEQPENSLTIIVPLCTASESSPTSRASLVCSWAQQKRNGCRFRPSLMEVSSRMSVASMTASLSSTSRSPTVMIIEGRPWWPNCLLVSSASRFISRSSSLSAASAVRLGSTCCRRPTRLRCWGHSDRNLWKARIFRIMPEKGWSPSTAPKTILSPKGARISPALDLTCSVVQRSCSAA